MTSPTCCLIIFWPSSQPYDDDVGVTVASHGRVWQLSGLMNSGWRFLTVCVVYNQNIVYKLSSSLDFSSMALPNVFLILISENPDCSY
jgi:hypothetical protein